MGVADREGVVKLVRHHLLMDRDIATHLWKVALITAYYYKKDNTWVWSFLTKSDLVLPEPGSVQWYHLRECTHCWSIDGRPWDCHTESRRTRLLLWKLGKPPPLLRQSFMRHL